MAYLVIIILSLLIQYVANSRNPQIDPRIHPSGSGVILNLSWFSTKLSVIDCASGIFNWSILDQNVCFWSFVLEIIIPLHLSFELFRWFHNLLHLHSFLFWLSIDTHIRSFVDHQVLCWILSDNVLHILSRWKFFPWYIMPMVNPILWIGQRWSAFELVLFTPKVRSICS